MRDYNFFEYFQHEKKGSDFKLIYIGAGFVIIALLLSIISIWTVIRISSLQKHVIEQKKIIEQPKYKQILAEKNLLEKKAKILNDYYSAVSAIYNKALKNDKINSNLLKVVSKQVPAKVSFQTMNINENQLTIQGTSKDRVSVAELEYNLKNSGIFYDVHLSNIISAGEASASTNQGAMVNPVVGLSPAASNDFSFNLTCKIKEEHENENK